MQILDDSCPSYQIFTLADPRQLPIGIAYSRYYTSHSKQYLGSHICPPYINKCPFPTALDIHWVKMPLNNYAPSVAGASVVLINVTRQFNKAPLETNREGISKSAQVILINNKRKAILFICLSSTKSFTNVSAYSTWWNETGAISRCGGATGMNETYVLKFPRRHLIHVSCVL